jgi:hypothetical protein
MMLGSAISMIACLQSWTGHLEAPQRVAERDEAASLGTSGIRSAMSGLVTVQQSSWSKTLQDGVLAAPGKRKAALTSPKLAATVKHVGLRIRC